MSRTNKGYDFYFASPFFSLKQIERERRLIRLLRAYGYKVYSPSENGIIASNEGKAGRTKCFMENLHAIKHSNAVFAITDTKDIGTIWETGYAYAKGKDVVYYAETLTGPFNLMLAESALGVFVSMDSLELALKKGCLDVFEAKEFE